MRASELGLLAAEHAETLLEVWRIQTAFAQVTRLTLPQAFNEKETTAVYKRRLASLLNMPDFAQLKGEMTRGQKAVRALFEALVGKAKA
jgi:hypothetical protein